MRIGIDTGGTFTDCVTIEESEVRILKVFTTAQNAARGIAAGISRMAGDRHRSRLEIVHGTTLGTNSLLERRGARVALVTTAGFEDLIEIGRQNRPRLYDLNVRREPPLVPRALRFGVHERTAARGTVLARPSPAELRRLKQRVLRARAESLAVCFLFSYANPSNERTVARALHDLGLPISVSHEILPEFREYERLSTVTINAYLAPRMSEYISYLRHMVGGRSELPRNKGREAFAPPHERGSRVYVMQSSGGISTAERAAREPVRTILSGPAGGVVAAAWLARQLGIKRAISFDMGGTSTDVCLIDGQPRTTSETTLGGLPVAVPVLDVHSVGAGGGSLARIDAGAALRVGPESAGADPGPACYRRGGTRPTVTDAHLLLGRLDSRHFLGGTHLLNLGAAERALDALLHKAGAMFKSKLELAQGIVAVANANMERALRVISVERGYDPRDFSLVSFGGAGGLHAADLARSLGMSRIIVPLNSGTFSALGILTSNIVRDVSRSVLRSVPQAKGGRSRQFTDFLQWLRESLRHLEAEARGALRREGFAAARAEADWSLDVRYTGQAYELAIPFDDDFPSRFHRHHEKAYGYAHSGRALEVVNLRVRLTIPTAKPPTLRPAARRRAELSDAVVGVKRVWFGSGFRKTSLYSREKLVAGMKFGGPAVIVEYSSTTIVPPDYLCRVDGHQNLILTRTRN
jgi:N-methylhydantoinase A